MRVLILNQAFYPDVVATAQHATDLALGLIAAGHQASVVCSARAYDDPSRRFPPRETWNGIRIYRVAGTGLGKIARWRRAIDFATFLTNCTAHVLFLSKFDLIVAMTSPPLISWIAAQLIPWKSRRLAVWSMDLNPDEAIAAGWLRSDSAVAKFLSALMTSSLRRADRVIALDRFMQKRIADKGVDLQKIAVVPPWPHDQHVRFDPNGRQQFRAEHGINDKFVVMYSGNHSPCHPLDTLLEAARQLQPHHEIFFCFIGGGSEFRKIEAAVRRERFTNVLCLPYQPLGKLAGSLSAADLHVVVMGEPFVGIIHPCKIYNVLAVGSPVLYLGPPESHISDIAARAHIERWVQGSEHGQTGRVVSQILQAAQANLPRPAYELPYELSGGTLLARMLDVLEQAGAADSEAPRPAAAFHD